MGQDKVGHLIPLLAPGMTVTSRSVRKGAGPVDYKKAWDFQ